MEGEDKIEHVSESPSKNWKSLCREALDARSYSSSIFNAVLQTVRMGLCLSQPYVEKQMVGNRWTLRNAY